LIQLKSFACRLMVLPGNQLSSPVQLVSVLHQIYSLINMCLKIFNVMPWSDQIYKYAKFCDHHQWSERTRLCQFRNVWV